MQTSSSSGALNDELASLLSSLNLPAVPREIRVIEILPGDYGEDGYLRVPSARVLLSDDFSSRFDQLVRAGYSWINLNYLGMHEGAAVVAVEVPRHATGAPKPSINYSGPPRVVSESMGEAATVLRVIDPAQTAMRGRALIEVLDELTAEGHEPMIRFVAALGERPWAGQLRFDVSMLRLWLAGPNVSHVQAMVTYGDGRRGGVPLSAALDRYDLTFFHGSQPTTTTSQTLAETLDRIGTWVTAGYPVPEPD